MTVHDCVITMHVRAHYLICIPMNALMRVYLLGKTADNQ